MNAEQHAFVEDMGQLTVGWGIARGIGRIWGYRLLHSAPVGLDQIARDLEMAKSGVSMTTRQLVQLGLAAGSAHVGAAASSTRHSTTWGASSPAAMPG